MEDRELTNEPQEQKGFFKLKPNQKYDESSSSALTGKAMKSSCLFVCLF